MIIRSTVLLLLATLAPLAAYPVGLAPSLDGTRLFVAMEQPPSVKVIEYATGAILATWPLPEAPRSLTISPDGARLFVPAGLAPGHLLTLDTATGAVVDSLACGHSPRAVTVTADGSTVFVCNQFENRVEVVKTAEKTIVGNFPAIREPVVSLLRTDGRALFVANLLPAGPANTGDIAAEVSVIDTANGATQTLRLPNGSTDARALGLSPDGRFVYLLHTLSRYALPTTQLDRGWMNTSALTVIDAANPRVIATVLLDDIDRGAANPAGVACSPDGRVLAISHAGTHELSLIDRPALHERIDRASRGEAVTAVTHALADIPNDLSFLHGLRRRVKLAGNGPRAVVATRDGFAVGCYFSATLHLVQLGPEAAVTIRDIALAPDAKETPERAGERMFFDATRCFQSWQSCATCHPGVRTDALNWDLLNDGMGNPKQTKNLLFTLQTPPAMISGVRPTGEIAIRTGMRYIMFVMQPEADALAIEAFLRTMPPVPSPALVGGQLSPGAVRGQEVFKQAGCATCHSGPHFTDGHAYHLDHGLGREVDQDWDTPTLREIWRTAPYLYDGRAVTLEEVIGKYNPGDQHGTTSNLTPDQRRDLVEYLRSL